MRRYGVVTIRVTPAAEWAWQRQSIWSQTADKLKAGPDRLWKYRLALTVAAAALALAGSQLKKVSLPASIALAVTAALALAAVGLLRGQQNVEQVRRWTRARSVSEAIKTEMFLFLTQTGRYDAPESNRRLELEAEVHRLENEAGNLQRYTDGVQPKDRPLPTVHDVDSYMEIRVRQSQLEGYYEPKARLMRQQLQTLKTAEVTLALVAAGLAAVAAISPSVGAWAAVVTTAGGAMAAYIAAQRYEFLWIEYSRTASELRRLLDRRTASDGRQISGPELVAECEQVISVQNQAWMAKWGEESTAE